MDSLESLADKIDLQGNRQVKLLEHDELGPPRPEAVAIEHHLALCC